MGLIDEARRAGYWLTELIDKQLDSARRLYATMDHERKVITRFPPDQARLYVVETEQSGQFYLYPGIAMGLLGHLYASIAERMFLDAAEWDFDFTERCQGDVYHTPSSGQIGWGASLMFSLTGDEAYREAACTVGDYLVRIRDDEGRWHVPSEDPVPDAAYLDITSEMVSWLSEIAQRLFGREDV